MVIRTVCFSTLHAVPIEVTVTSSSLWGAMSLLPALSLGATQQALPTHGLM